MVHDSVIFKGNKKGIAVILDSGKPFDEIVNSIRQKLTNAVSFFAGAKVNIVFKGRDLREAEKQKISEIVTDIVGSDTNIEFESESSDHDERRWFDDTSIVYEGITRFYKGTVRSGQRISFNGNLIILGDVNPGAEVVAVGNVIVMGSLRGIVHAGCIGNREAVVAALNLQPTLLKIADVITRSPDDSEEKKGMEPEIAYIRGEHILIDCYLPKKSI
ncbi:MAG: septum site-determining protein MinC [Clostridiaceae bacterium]|nr:septum site-determining protein MinC [Clostridiaceae bacterium]